MKIFLDASFLIYLNASVDNNTRLAINELFKDTIKNELYTDILVIDEVLYVSMRKYKVPYGLTFRFLDSVIMPLIEVIPLSHEDYERIKDVIKQYNIMPSDAIHISAMKKMGIKKIVSEDEDFDIIPGIERIWLKT